MGGYLVIYVEYLDDIEEGRRQEPPPADIPDQIDINSNGSVTKNRIIKAGSSEIVILDRQKAGKKTKERSKESKRSL